MLKKERQTYIMKQINLHNKVLSSDLSQQLDVSEDTIRRDLNELDEAGKLLKVHGGALSKSFHFPFHQNEVYAQESKRQVALKAINLIKEGMVVLTGGGTTMIEMAKLMPEELDATFFTISPLVALELAEHPRLTVILIGGQLSKNAQINIGARVINDLSEIKVDICFLGANGIDFKEGITDSDWEVVQVKKAMIKSTAKVVILSIAEKLNSVQKMRVCGLNQVTHFITDLDPGSEDLAPFKDGNIQIF
ncbi:MAG: DeoR/GlpR family DNA-binding transcription regulator [Bacteroidetes bacterium]|nr:DeoR/GlpR family DNA-binding transcription regulator [Bacteroidota bacterium]MBU1484324.1 DeoR/GlpR family DNA-binding transcription regulator [Bacteroidota bacterium]MBU2045761.1 DeoR/GlpR family DNA-binding transcription regulator [Bacteroidota bacterium]MBU2266809.1 DeoR/GlpR family DNA-binding transcription regulator [Bacteroidota bacterium]MBU2377012.1 DeoR/GlpR family DNA-binding transcription regulator [Bacteroidota bacterium]